MSYITVDSSTSSTTVLVFDEKLEILKKFQKDHSQIVTQEGYIEHDLEEIYQNLLELVQKLQRYYQIQNLSASQTNEKLLHYLTKKMGNPYTTLLYGNVPEVKVYVKKF